MTPEDRVLSEARKVWQEDAAPSESSVRRGVDRVLRQLRLKKHSAVAPRLWAASGATAAFIATLAYAGRGSFLQPVWDALASRGALVTEGPAGARAPDPLVAPPSARLAAPPPAGLANRAPAAAPAARDIVLDDDQPVLPNGALGNGAGGSGSLAPLARTGTRGALSSSPAGEFVGADGRRGSTARSADTPRSGGARSGHARTSAASRRASQAQARAAATVREPSWSDVNEALAVHDRARASELLTRLAEHGPDADTRAKALLGIAQLAAGAGDCEKGRTLALEVAARSGIELKTIRRALELASRCAP